VNLACSGSVVGTAAGYATWTSVVGGGENVPINCITWQEAYAFCIWDGGFLPSEAEWEYAAAGGNEQREYPWGTTAPGTANQYAIYDCHYPSGQNCFGVKNIAPVGTATSGAGLWGQLDLAGNLGQWTLDSYVGYVDPCTDCAFATAGSRRVFRGGVFSSVTSDLLPPARSSAMRASRDHTIGFRCARAP
jgi:formylglycine-generating enzyme required for sulfatase activity